MSAASSQRGIQGQKAAEGGERETQAPGPAHSSSLRRSVAYAE